MMIRAGKREEVLASDSMWMCTSCYNCIVRCPRKLPITHIMHGLANYAHRLGKAPGTQVTRDFAQRFWNNFLATGRINEMKLTMGWYFKEGLGQGVKNALANQDIGKGMMKAKRLNPMELFGGHGVKDKSGFQKMVAKAREIEDQRRGLAG